jgi:hypothetical protein
LERAIAGFDRQEGRLSYLAIVALARQLPKNYDDKDEQDEPLNDDELRSEYDLSKLQGGIRGKYVERYLSWFSVKWNFRFGALAS